ncbi:MAG TPA: hypothetical protein VL983_09060 [Terriglobales bacterium]|nr:hypothetical protein [Terriglobales bacterium]
MKCFSHPEMDAVGSCKHCFKGVCARCAKDSGVGVVCSQACEDEVRSVRAMMERGRKMYPLAAKTQLRSAIWLVALAAVFIAWGLISEHGAFMIVIGAVMLLGAGFAGFNSRRMAKL